MADRPDQKVASQLPISIYSGWDKVQDVLSLLAQHDYGMFRNSAIFVDSMWRDDRIKGVLSARTGSLLATPMVHKPSSQEAKAKLAHELLAGGEDSNGVFDLICPASTLEALSGWAVTMDLCVAELVWVAHPTIKMPSGFPMWIPRLKPWHPQFVYWDWQRFCYALITGDGVVYLPKVDEQVYSDGKWFVYSPHGFQYGWLRAAVRSLAMLYIARGWGNRDWSRHSEVQGIAIRKAYVPADADAADKEEFYQSVVNAGAELTIECEFPTEGQAAGFDVKYEEAKARTWECFKDLLGNKNVDIAIDILGQELSTSAAATGLGSGVANIQNQVRMDIRKSDAKIALAIRSQVTSWWAFYNLGDPEYAPKSEFQVDPPEDELAESTALEKLGDAVVALKAASSRVDGDAILEAHGVPLLSPEEVEAIEQKRAERVAKAFQSTQQQQPGQPQIPPGKRDQQPKQLPPAGGQAQLGAMSAHPSPGPVKRYEFQGLPIAVENPAGTMRHWYAKGEATPRGSTQMLHDYGFIEGYAGSDGEDLDVYVGPDETAQTVHVVHQLRSPEYRTHDEDKVFLGFPSADAARAAFLAHRNDGEQAIGGMSSIPLERFKSKLQRRTGRGKITASAARELWLGAQRALVDAFNEEYHRPTTRVELATLRTVAGKKRASRYVDRLEGNAKKLAAAALRPDLELIKREIKAATSPEDLRRRLTHAYRSLRPAELAAVIKKANLMANLYGRVEAVDSL